MAKPKFYRTELKLIRGDVLEHVYGDTILTMEERMGSEEAECPECNKNEWWLLPKEGIAVKEGGKPYIECLNCGYQTHL